jgi:hypothetical protein
MVFATVHDAVADGVHSGEQTTFPEVAREHPHRRRVILDLGVSGRDLTVHDDGLSGVLTDSFDPPGCYPHSVVGIVDVDHVEPDRGAAAVDDEDAHLVAVPVAGRVDDHAFR